MLLEADGTLDVDKNRHITNMTHLGPVYMEVG